MSANDFERIYPPEVYRFVSDKGKALVDGTILLPFPRELAEAIAQTKPDWARFSDTTLGPEVLTVDHNIIEISWARNFGKYVCVSQEIQYTWQGDTIGVASFPHAEIFIDFGTDIHDPAELVDFAASLSAAAALLTSPSTDSFTA